jgi:RHS repeat-associated protein
VWDGNDLVHEVVDGAPLVTWEMEPGSFAPLAKVEGEKRYGVVTDHLGTPRVLVDDVGELAWKAQLDVYGVARVEVEKTSCPWRWPGQYEDEETGLYYNRFRYYDPETGRYISQDPIRLKGGLDIYAYVSDPLSLLDPLGLSECGWSNKRVKDAAKALERGEASVWLKTRSEAEELFLGRYIGGNDASEMFRNTTGLTAMETKSLLGSKANTYHWDDALDELGHLADHELGHPDSRFRHLQLHPKEGSVIRIFFGDPLW